MPFIDWLFSKSLLTVYSPPVLSTRGKKIIITWSLPSSCSYSSKWNRNINRYNRIEWQMIQKQKRCKENFMEEWPQKMSRSLPNRQKDMNLLAEKLSWDSEKEWKWEDMEMSQEQSRHWRQWLDRGWNWHHQITKALYCVSRSRSWRWRETLRV